MDRGRGRGISVLAWVSVLLAFSAPARTQTACSDVVATPAQLAATLLSVPKYFTTYVLVYPDRLSDQIESVDSPALTSLRLAVYEGSAAAMIAAARGWRNVKHYPSTASATQIVEEVLAGALDAGVLWAPLAGLGVLELDLEYALSLFTVGEPSPVPTTLRAAEAAVALPACAEEITVLLESYGVVPAEKLVPLDIRELLLLRPPRRDHSLAMAGAELYAEHCAKCHGPAAVAAQDALAPVDLLISTPRFSFPGFLYIVLNGRTQNGMPGFRGALTQEQLELIYQYVRERSHGTLSTGGVASGGGSGG